MTERAGILRFDRFELNIDGAELMRDGLPVALEPQTFDLVACLVQNAGRILTRDELIEKVWNGRIVSDAAISTRINAARAALGDDGKRQRYIKTVVRRGFRFVGELTGEPEAAMHRPAQFSGVRYLRSFDGTHLAYEISGEGPPVMKATGFLNHVEMERDSPVWRHFVRVFSQTNRYIRVDQRGCGLSDWEVDNLSLDSYVEDIRASMDSLDVPRTAIFGMSQGAAIAAAFAHRYPERVGGLILLGGYPAGWRKIGDPDFAAKREAMLELIKVGWGGDNPAFRAAASPENAYKILSSFADFDVRHTLCEIHIPALVLHARGDAMVKMEAGRQFARLMPNARFVESDNHILMEDEPAWNVFQREIRAFMSQINI
jgi:pimeloyl-ACP methyl ester carboxylesterase/DNA-binding winged helix-turn-helix (wHTH) protein